MAPDEILTRGLLLFRLLPLLLLLLAAAAGRTEASDGCQSGIRQSLQPLHSDACVPDVDVQRQLRLPNAQLLTGATDPNSCAMACALRPSACAVAQFRFVARLCHVTPEMPRPASKVEAADTATRGDCVATLLRRDASGATGWQFASRLAAFFDFRISDRNLGTVGVDSPLSASAQFVGTTVRNASGAVLPGLMNSFVKIPVQSPGFQALASPTKEYTFFFSILGLPTIPSSNDQIHLLRVVPSSNPTGSFCSFAYFQGSKLKFANLFTETIGYVTDSSMPLAPQQKFFVGVSYSSTLGASTAVYNGTAYSVSQYKTYTLSTNTVFDEIRLGSEGTRDYFSLNATIVCFAMAQGALSTQEFLAMASVC